jgi:carboxyl-terminal processing protease
MKILTLKNVVIGLSATLATGLFAFTQADERLFEIARNLDIFASVYKEINTYYVDEINPSKTIRTGIDDMLGGLDPYTNYIPEDEIEDYRTMTTGQYGGIGSVIGKHHNKTVIIMPYPNSPATIAGLKIGDVIVAIDGKPLDTKENTEVSKFLKGQANTTVKLLIERYGEKAPFEITVTRKQIKLENVPYYGMLTDNIGYLHLSEFMNNAAKDVETAIKELKKTGAKSVVFDLRANPGGLLNEAVDISNLFIPKGKDVVSTKGKIVDWNKTYTALNQPLDAEMPIVVLINGRSASASEIVSGVIQDYDRGVLIGQKSYGKGLVQSTRPLPYNSQIKLTVAKYYTPSGRCIQALDYTHRNEDGTVSTFADSLKTAFKTKNGRTVYDGGGVTPDILVEKKEIAQITTSLVGKSLIFDYATKYAYEHKSIVAAKDFKMSDAAYADFVKFIADKEYDYKTKVETNLEVLIATAKKEAYYDGIKDKIESLKAQISHNKEKDLYTFRKEIQQALEEDIASRYYLQKGAIEASFDHDEDILEAIKILKDTERYKKLLSGK